MKGIVLAGVLSDGTATDATVTYVFGDLHKGNEPYLDEHGEPVATVTLRVLTREQVRKLQRRHTKPRARNGQMVDELDRDAYLGELVDLMIVDWAGLMGSDNAPLACTKQAKLRLGDARLSDMLELAVQNESVVGADATFRASA